LSLFGSFRFGKQFDAAAGQVAAEVLRQQLGMGAQESKAWGDALVCHHSWMVLDRWVLHKLDICHMHLGWGFSKFAVKEVS
jgi:hypothetical protein